MQRDWNGSYTMSESEYMDICEQLSRAAQEANLGPVKIQSIRGYTGEYEDYLFPMGWPVIDDGKAKTDKQLEYIILALNSMPELLDRLVKAQALNKSLSGAYDALWKEKELLLSVLKEWQEFAADSTASCYSEQESLDYLKARTARIVDPCS